MSTKHTNRPFTYHMDPGHGWLAVPRSLVTRLNLDDSISRCSFVRAGTAYLEEDCDMPRFIEAYRLRYGMEPAIQEVYSTRSSIRRYARFVPDTTSDITDTPSQEGTTMTTTATAATRLSTLEYAAAYAQAVAEDIQRDLDALEGGYCDHGSTCQGTVHHVDCTVCPMFTHDGRTRGYADESVPFTCDAAALASALKRVKYGISSRSALPILSGVLIDCGTLTTTDLDVTVQAHVPGTGYVHTVAPVALLEKVLGKMAGTVTLQASPGSLQVSAGSRSYTLNAWSASDFPQTWNTRESMPTLHDMPTWADMWARIEPCISRDATRPIISTMMVTADRVVATDSYRLAVYPWADTMDVPDTLVSLRAGTTVRRLMGARGGSVAYSVARVPEVLRKEETSGGMPVFRVTDKYGAETMVAARPVEGKFPDYRQLIPEFPEIVATVDRARMVDAVDAVSLMAQANAPVRVTLGQDQVSGDWQVGLSALTQGVGSASEALWCDVTTTGSETDAFCIGFSPQYLADGLASIDSDRVCIALTTPLRPALMYAHGTGGQGFIYLLMPIRLSDANASFAPGAANRAACAA